MPNAGWAAPEGSLDWMLIVSKRHLEVVLAEYVRHYNQERPHRSCKLRPPAGACKPVGHGAVRSRLRLGGLIHEYYRDRDAAWRDICTSHVRRSLPEGGRALVVGHSPTNEAAI